MFDPEGIFLSPSFLFITDMNTIDIRLPISKFTYRDCSSIDQWSDMISTLPAKADILQKLLIISSLARGKERGGGDGRKKGR
jgi:hypothetical protein